MKTKMKNNKRKKAVFFRVFTFVIYDFFVLNYRKKGQRKSVSPDRLGGFTINI